MRSGKHLFVQVFSEINKALLVKKSMSVCGSDKIPQTPTLTPKNNNNNSNNSTEDDDTATTTTTTTTTTIATTTAIPKAIAFGYVFSLCIFGNSHPAPKCVASVLGICTCI